MSLESFYGGKQGISPVIKNSFEFIDANDFAYQAAITAKTPVGGTISASDKAIIDAKTMDLCFANASYKNVWYDELCIIDTINKNNPNNGKIFKRTLKGAGDTGTNLCAEYVGRIVGPAGTNPFLSFGNFNFINDKGKKENIDLAPEMQVSYPIDANGTISSAKTEIIEGEEVQIDIEPVIQSASIGNTMIVPGKQGTTYNDDIKYTWLNVVDDTRETPTRSIVYMGFQIPYPSLEISSETTDWMNIADIQKRTSEEYDSHPFFHSWNIIIPRGVRGNAATAIRLVQQQDFSNTGGTEDKPHLYAFNDFVTDAAGVYTLRENPPGPGLDTTLPDSYIWVYDYTFYDADAYDNSTTDTKEISKTYTFYLGPYKEIIDVDFEPDGSLIFNYSNSTSDEYPQMLQWINDIAISNTGKLSFVCNNDKYRPTADLNVDPNKIYYILDNYGEYQAVTIEEFTAGVTYYEYTNIYSKQLPYPSSVTVGADGVITVSLRNGTELRLQDSSGHNDYKFDYVNYLEMDTNTKVISYKTSALDSGGQQPLHPLNSSKGINYIETMTIDEKYHLLAYYSSTQYRITQTDITNGWKYRPGVISGTSNRIPVTTSGNYAYWDGKTFRKGIAGYDNIYWQDFGTMRDVAFGVKVYTTVDYSQHPDASLIDLGTYSPENFISTVLNPQYWDSPTNLIENIYYAGNIPGAEEGQSFRGTFLYVPAIREGSLFFYDYDADTWVYAGSLGDSSQVDAQIQLNIFDPTDEQTKFNSQQLSTYGVAFVERTEASSTDLLPSFWS